MQTSSRFLWPPRRAPRARSRTFFAALALLCLFGLAAPGCNDGGSALQRGPVATPSAGALRTSASAGANVDLAAVMRRAHFAFRPDGEAWKAKHATYTVR